MRIVEKGDLFSEEKGSGSKTLNKKPFWGVMMGYKVTIEEIDFQANGIKKLPEELTDDMLWELSKDKIEVTEKWITWNDDDMRKDMTLLAQAGVYGEMLCVDEYGLHFKYTLGDGIVSYYEADCVYPEEPEWTST